MNKHLTILHQRREIYLKQIKTAIKEGKHDAAKCYTDLLNGTENSICNFITLPQNIYA